jgi:hypothetical protein
VLRGRGLALSAAPAMPGLQDWEATRDTLHLWLQVVGTVKLGTAAPRNHLWHAALYPGVRGLTTGRLGRGAVRFAIEVDLVDHRLAVRSGDGREGAFELADGLSVAEFDRRLRALLAGLDLDAASAERPHGGPGPATTPPQEDTAHASYDRQAAHSWWLALDWVSCVLDEFAGRFQGKQSPVHLFWNSFDLVLTRYSGRPAPLPEDADPVTRQVWSHELISFGFWPGDRAAREPGFYALISPEPDGLREQPLASDQAVWEQAPSGSRAVLGYDAVRAADDPRQALLAFLESAYQAGAGAAYWDREELAAAVEPGR